MKVGSILDLLPRPRTTEYNALPKFIQAEIDVLRKGGRPVVADDLREVLEHVATVPKRLNDLAIEQRITASSVKDVHKAQSEFGARLLPLIEAIHKRLDAHETKIGTHDQRLDAHDVVIGVHAKKHVEHDKKHVEHVEAITGVIKKLVVLEETVLTKTRKPRKRK